jgi:hypothetical protein
LLSQKSDESGIIPDQRVHHCGDEPFITFIFATESINVGASTAEMAETRLVLGHTDAAGWCRTVVDCQWPLRNTARPRRSSATPAPGSAFMILARPVAVH